MFHTLTEIKIDLNSLLKEFSFYRAYFNYYLEEYYNNVELKIPHKYLNLAILWGIEQKFLKDFEPFLINTGFIEIGSIFVTVGPFKFANKKYDDFYHIFYEFLKELRDTIDSLKNV